MTKKYSSNGPLQESLFPLESSWKPPEMSQLPNWTDAKRIAIDCETRDPDLKELGPGVRRGSYIVGISFAIEDGPCHYLPFRHEGGDNLPESAVLSYFRDQAKNFTGDLVGANMQYDLDFMMKDGIEWNPRFFRDVQIADPLINELHLSYSLQNIAIRHGLPGKATDELVAAAREYRVDPKSSLWRLPARFVGGYAEQDTLLPLQLLRRQERIIEEQDLWKVYDLESRVLPVLLKLRRRGVRISEAKLAKIENWSLEEEARCLREVEHQTGVKVPVGEVMNADLLSKALNAIGFSVPKTATGKESVKKDVLSEIDHPVAKLITQARKVNKLRTTFAASIRRYLINGRIHCTFNQLRMTDDETDKDKGAAYGRLSSDNPNMQQQPARDEFAKAWRDIYEPEEGALWAAKDYSQQEPRWTIHYAEELNLPRANEAGQKYRDDPSTDNHQMMADLSGVPRKEAKELFLGKCYGMGGAKLCRKIGLPTRWTIYWKGQWDRREYYTTRDEAMKDLRKQEGGANGRVSECAGEAGQRIIDKFESELPFVSKLAKRCQEVADKRGYVKTWSGRRCRFPTNEDGTFDWTHKALNRIIQGSSADQTKLAMIELDKAGAIMHLQVHDEIDSSVQNREEAERYADIMRNVIPLRVPMKVDVEIGPSWGTAA